MGLRDLLHAHCPGRAKPQAIRKMRRTDAALSLPRARGRTSISPPDGNAPPLVATLGSVLIRSPLSLSHFTVLAGNTPDSRWDMHL